MDENGHIRYSPPRLPSETMTQAWMCLWAGRASDLCREGSKQEVSSTERTMTTAHEPLTLEDDVDRVSVLGSSADK